MIRIPVYQPCLIGNEKRYVEECLDSTWISSKGRFIPEFERRFAEYTGVKHAASVCNGTVALHLALIALGVGPGDEVIVPTLTYISSVNAISYTGATPVFVDSIENTWQMDPEDVQRKLTDRTRAIMVVHLYGHPCDMDALTTIAKKYGLFIVEDCAEAFGTLYKGKHVGNFGDIATYSFFGNKSITTGEGGMVVTNDETLHDRSIHFKGQGLAKHRQYWHDVIGYNYRMTNICAALGLAQLEQANMLLEQKREIAQKYRNGLSGLSVTFHNETPNVRHSFWMCSIWLMNRHDAILSAKRWTAQESKHAPFVRPIHTMPMYSTKFQRHPVAESLGWRGINLPSWPGLEEKQISYICQMISKFIKRER